ncbi:MAG: hypothetical protein CV088_17555 [Nitrospira sp. LK70]|nr:hypothetical protein [Nitrospira sp. LK70]
MQMRRISRGSVLFGLILSLLLASCGSGGEGVGEAEAPIAPPVITGTPEGLWSGTRSNGGTIWGAVLDDGSFWFLYSAVGDPTIVRGAMQGISQSDNGTFTASDIRDFSGEDGLRLHGTISGSYVPQESLNGTASVTWDDTQTYTTTFRTTHHAPSVDASDLAQLAGTYPGRPFGEGSVQALMTMTISPSGSLRITGNTSSTSAGWTAMACFETTGTLTPRAQPHVYNLTIDNVCVVVNEPHTGVAIFDPDTKSLSLLALNQNRTSVFFYRGTQQ